MRKQVLHPRTAVINQKQKNQSKRARLEALRWLAQRFPLAFDNTKRIAPLSIGIMSDLLAYADEALQAGISKSKLREAVVVYTRRLDYLACLKAREMRVDLNGQAVEMVTEEDAESAAIKIKKRIEKTARNAQNTIKTAVRTQEKKPRMSADTNGSFDARVVAHATPHYALPPSPTSTVTIKHKTTRTFDPSAVARLKAKLGLSVSKDEASKD